MRLCQRPLHCIVYCMHGILYHFIWYMVCMVHYILTFLTMSSKLGLRADAPIVVQPHWKSICRQRYNQYSSAIAALHPHYVLWNRIDKYKGFCDKRCPWTKLFLDLAKVADVNIATSNKTSFLFHKNPFARVKSTSFQAGNRHLFMTKHVRSIYCLLPSFIQQSCFSVSANLPLIL